MSEKIKVWFKSVGIILAILVGIVCLILNSWFLYIKLHGETKMTSTTVNMGELNLADGSTKEIIQVKHKRNKNRSGVELFEIKLNYLTDESQKDFYSQGIQYAGNGLNDNIKWKDFDYISKTAGYWDNKFKQYKLQEISKFLWKGNYYASYFSPFTDTKKYEYQSFNDFETLGSTNPITPSSYFTLQLGGTDEVVYMQLKGDNYAVINKVTHLISADQEESIGYKSREGTFESDFITIFNNYNMDYFAYTLYQSISTLPSGTKGKFVFEFGNIFKYFLAENGFVGKEIQTEDSTKVINNIKSYYTISVEVYEDGAKNANDSMFGVIKNDPTFSIKPSYGESGNYFAGTSILDCDIYDFDLVRIDEIYCALKLKKEFLSAYEKYAKDIKLNIIIDTSILKARGLDYAGFASDSGLEKFTILNTTILEVQYA